MNNLFALQSEPAEPIKEDHEVVSASVEQQKEEEYDIGEMYGEVRDFQK